MTISTTTSRAEYIGNGVTTVFAFPYPFFADVDLTVLLLRATGVVDTLVLNTDYTVSGEGTPSSGQVTLMTAPASGESLFILRELALTQETDYISGDPFPAESHERALDRLTLIDQQQQEQLGRSLTLNPTSSSGVSTELPVPEANALIGWNTAADGLQNYVGTSSALVSSAMGPVVAAATLADARSKLGATAVGEALFTAANALVARNSLGLGVGADIASASTLPLAARTGNIVRITGVVPVTATDLENGGQVWAVAAGALPLTHHATNMPLQGGSSYTCAPDDVLFFERDSSGALRVLIFKKDGTPVTSVVGFRNRLINGGMAVDQRNAGAAQTFTAAAALAYCVDRWYGYCTGANVNGQRVAGSGGNQYRYQFTGAASVTGIGFGQRIEKANCIDLAGSTATLSVDLANSLLNTVTWTAYYANTDDTFGTLASPTRTQIATGTFTVNSTVTRYSTQISIPGAATTGIEIVLSVGAQISGTWTIGNVQLEMGAISTPFERRPISYELAACQRRYLPGSFGWAGAVYANSAGTWRAQEIWFPIQMAATPTLVLSNISYVNCSSASIGFSSPLGFAYNVQIGGSTNYTVNSGNFTATAEL